MRILIDASAWVPMAVVRDQHGPRLRTIRGRLTPADRLMTTNWTLYEALALARHRQPPTAGRLFQIATNIASVVPVDQAVEREALRRFLTWTDKGASVVDHANVLVALQRRCDAILSFDDDFAELVPNTGLQLLR